MAKLTKDECEILLDWAESNKQADLDSYRAGRPPWDISARQCRNLWNSIKRKCKRTIKQGSKK